ncbi:MAG: carbamoyltransferase HypF, partial [Actinobacteria bacterium]|nr:carbamoyltransferase HypF [Actinomycetota bacterium]
MITKTFQIDISGIVQGVGFRPFIFKLAFENKLHGDVCNTTSGLIIRINAADITAINNFVSQIRNKKPEPAVIESLDVKEIESLSFDDFKIIESKSAKENFQLVSPDLATCDKCLNDISDTTSKRRFNYAFTNCTNCGPRFTIIKKLPYDRKNTTMSDFEMCPECRNEYINPLDRRFHAQPNACSLCGPKLVFTDGNGKILDEKDPVGHAVKEILKGKIIGIKSLGGFQIACDATSDKAVLKLRKKKKRPFKPFAVMIKNIGYIKTCFKISKAEKNLLSSPKAPVVLLKKKKSMNLPINAKQDSSFPISRYVSFNNNYEGVMLPYTPLHHLLFKKINFPLIMTSGNISEEPISCENIDALKKLSSICDFFLIHNRDIYSRFDDSVVKIFKNREMVIRRARGYAPYPLKIKSCLKNDAVLAIGSEEKNTFCIVKKNYAIISQHIGDIDNDDSIDFFKNTLSNYRTLFNIDKFNLAVSDKHPAFRLNHLALDCVKSGKKVIVQHHEAHIASAIAENQINKKIVGFAWDGTGYGNDGKIWGSEIFIVDENLNFKRVGHLMEKILPGGEITIRKPYRMAITYIYYCWINISGERSDLHNNINRNNKIFSDDVYDFIKYFRKNFYNLSKVITDKEISSIIFQIKNKFNSIETTSMGRLFDAFLIKEA